MSESVKKLIALLLVVCFCFTALGAADGETGEGGADAKALETALSGRFYALEVQDHTRVAADIWARAGEDSLRGLFLRELRSKWDAAADDAEREHITQAVRFGLAALDHRDLG